MLEAVKLALRITSSVFDEDLQATIDACKADLRLAVRRARTMTIRFCSVP